MAKNLQDLRMFVAVYEEQSFTAAAAREHATQPGVSHHITKLEKELGAQLFARGAGVAVQPTPAAHSFYRAVLEVLNAYERALGSVREHATGLQGEIKVGLIPTITRSILAGALATSMELHPNLQITVVEGLSHELLTAVRTGELDFALGVIRAPAAGVRCTPFSRWPCVLVSGPRSARTDLQPVRLAELKQLRLVAARRPNAVRSAIDAYVALHGAEVEQWLELDSIPATLSIVARTSWSAVLPGPAIMAGHTPYHVTVNSIAHPPLFLDIALMENARRPRRAEAEAFLQQLMEEDQRVALALPRATRGHQDG